MRASGIEVTGAFLQAVKIAEESDALILRLVEPSGADGEATAMLWKDIKAADVVDIHENPFEGTTAGAAAGAATPAVSGRIVRCPIRGGGTLSLRVTL